jgi:hypothetical protein
MTNVSILIVFICLTVNTYKIPIFENPNRKDWREHIMLTFYGGEFLYTQRIAVSEQ